MFIKIYNISIFDLNHYHAPLCLWPQLAPFWPNKPCLANMAHARTFLPRARACMHGSSPKFLCEFSTITSA